MINRITYQRLRLLLLAAFLSGSGNVPAGAEQSSDGKDYSKEVPQVEKSWCEAPPPWEVRIGVPGWLSGVSGTSGVKGVTNFADVSFDSLLDNLTHFPIALSIDARYRRWEFYTDGEYIEVGTSATLPGLLFTNANVHIRYAFAEGFVGYRLINCDKAFLSFFAGARWSHLGGDLSIFDNGDARLVRLRELLGIPKKLDFSDSTGWVDPVIGLRGKVRIWKPISLYAQGDVGGFDANSASAFELRREGRTIVKRPVDSSDWSYQVQGGAEIQVSRWFWVQLGWRYLSYDYRQEGFTDKTALNGPLVQAGVNF
jgi:hypothetical protein